MTTWECGTPKSQNNAFTDFLAPASPPPKSRKKPGPKKQPRSIVLPGSRSLSIDGRLVVPPQLRSHFEIGTTDSDKTRKLLRAAI